MASEIKKIYEFGRFRFDAQRLRLEHDGAAIHLPPKSLETLKVLLEERGETVPREQMLERIWAESFVEDANLTVAVSVLRKTFSAFDSSETYIQTVPRKGYRFVADAAEKIEITEQPIIIERRAIERITIEENEPRRFPKAFAVAAALILIAAVGVFGFWRLSGNSSASEPASSQFANEAFSKGVALLQKRQVCESIPYFREAIAKDERNARAYSNLAAALAMCGDLTDEADKANAAALALDANLPEAQATDGFLKLFRHWDWDGAEKALRRAVALDPNSAKAHHWLGVSLSIRGRLFEAAGEMTRAIEIEPDSPLYHADLGQIYYFAGDSDRALKACQKSLELDPNFIFTARYLRDIYLMRGDEQKAWEYEAKDLLNNGRPPESIKANEAAFRRNGFNGLYQSRVSSFLEQIKNGNPNAKNRAISTLALADNYALLGDRRNTLYWLEQSFEGEKGNYPFAAAYVGVEPRFAFVRKEPRFQAILQKMNLKIN